MHPEWIGVVAHSAAVEQRGYNKRIDDFRTMRRGQGTALLARWHVKLIQIGEFRERLRNNDVDYLLNEVLLAEDAMHVKLEDITHVERSLARKFSVPQDGVKVWIVGSAKLGFSLTQKQARDGSLLRRYRSFSADSDIDVAVVSTVLFDIIWNELSAHAHRASRLPWDSGRLGDYLICGWLRPDHFPNHTRLMKMR